MSDEVTAIIEGATSGRGYVTGRHYRVEAGEEIEVTAPRAEFKTLPTNRVTIVEGSDSGQAEMSVRRYDVNGAYKDFYEGGELVAENVRCKKSEAQAWADGDATLSDIQD